MAFTSQFSLSLELTNLVPTAIATTRALLRLARDLSKSGSDIIVEQDLADIFGRNRIAPQFESSFKAAVKDSSVVKLPSLVDVVLEAGAGPTVVRSIKYPEYFATVVQLSLLAYTHQLARFKNGLLRALELRAKDAAEVVDLPEHEKLFGTLRAIQEQTAGYRWELILCAIEDKCASDQKSMHQLMRSRHIPQVVLQGLLDTLTAVQRWEEHFLRIRLATGVSTVVAWAHNILGLAVTVVSEGSVHTTFGTGTARVHIEWLDVDDPRMRDSQGIVLLSRAESGQVEFQLSKDRYEQDVLHPSCQHTVLGFGLRALLSDGVRMPDLQTQIAQLVVAMCMATCRETVRQIRSQDQLPQSKWIFPSDDHLYTIGKVLFDGISMSYEAVRGLADHKDLRRFDWNEEALPLQVLAALQKYADATALHSHYGEQFDFRFKGPYYAVEGAEIPTAPHPHLYYLVYTLCEVILALGCIGNLDDALHMPLEVVDGRSGHSRYHGRGNYELRLPSVSQAWRLLVTLLCSQNSVELARIDQTSVASSSGWTLILSTLQSRSPCHVKPYITVHRGVPARYQERRNWVADAVASGEMICYDDTTGFCRTEHVAGERMQQRSKTRAVFQQPKIGVSNSAFEVLQIIEVAADDSGDVPSAHIQIGYRELQEVFWNAIVLPPCQHGDSPDRDIIIAPDCAAFSGWRTEAAASVTRPRTWDTNNDVNLAMTSGRSAAQWALLFTTSGQNARHFLMNDWQGLDEDIATYVKNADCCVECAVEMVRTDRPGHPKILVL